MKTHTLHLGSFHPATKSQQKQIHFPRGWWLLPMAVAGLAMWYEIIKFVLALLN